MTTQPPPRLNPDGTISSVFNLNDYKYNTGSVTFEDLLSYANLFTNNIFRGFNRFNSIQILGTINNINSEFLQYIQYIPNIIIALTDITYDEETDTTIIENNLKANNIECDEVNGFNSFQFLQGLSENVQDALDLIQLSISNMFNRMIGISYSNNKTIISNSVLEINDLEAANITSSHFSSNTINITNINSNRMFCNRIRTDKMECDTIKCKTIIAKDDIGLYLYINGLTFPVMKSTPLSSIYTDTIVSCAFTIKPRYVVGFINSDGLLIQQYANTSDNMKYNINVTNIDFNRINLYLNGEML